MHPILLKLGPVTIYSYGAMVAAGFAAALFMLTRDAPKSGIAKSKVIDLAILALFSGIIGARLLYILINPQHYLSNPLEIINLSKGGLVWYGGFITAIAAVGLYIGKAGLKFWTLADLFAPCIALAQAFGRIGCFLNGCCYGVETGKGFIFAIRFPGQEVYRQPVELYSAAALFLIFVILRFMRAKRLFSGAVFLAYLTLYSFKRFVIEFLRGDNPHILLGLTMSQVISIIVLAVSMVIFIRRRGK